MSIHPRELGPEERRPAGRSAETAMNIALFCDYSLDYLGGAQSAFLDQAHILGQHGHDVTLFFPAPRTSPRTSTPHDADGRDPSPRPSVPGVAELPIPARWTLPGVGLPVVRNSAALRERLRAELESRRIDVVHVHSEFGLTAAAIDAARELGIPVVHTVHTFFWQTSLPRPLTPVAASVVRGFARWARGFPASRRTLAPSAVDSALRGMTLSTAECADVIISPSAHQARRLAEAGLANIVQIENSTPVGSQNAQPLAHVSSPLRVVWIGRMTPEKRVLEFVHAAMAARRTLGPGALSVELIGDGPLLPAVKRAIASEGAPDPLDMRLLGRLTRDQVRERIRRSHLVALTSLGFDNQPVVVVEAFNEARSVLYVDANLQEGSPRAASSPPRPTSRAWPTPSSHSPATRRRSSSDPAPRTAPPRSSRPPGTRSRCGRRTNPDDAPPRPLPAPFSRIRR